MIPGEFDQAKVQTQLKYTGVLETTRIRQQVCPHFEPSDCGWNRPKLPPLHKDESSALYNPLSFLSKERIVEFLCFII